MMSNANTLLIDSPTNHLDLESIEAVNNGFSNYQGAIILSSHDHRLLDTVCNKIVEIGDLGSIQYQGTLDEYISNANIKERLKTIYQ